MQLPRFSVVIPTRDRPGALAGCLAALRRQQGCGEFEVVVVDDGSRLEEEVAAVVRHDWRSRLVRMPPTGSAPARNLGAREARSPLVLFVDDDCEPRPQWAAALTSALENGAKVVAGCTLNADPEDVFAEATQVVLEYITLRSVAASGDVAFAPTCNLACVRELLLDLPFDERYVNSGADRDWCARLARRGHSIAFQRDAIVDHRQLLDLSAFVLKHREYGQGSAKYHRRQAVRFERPGFYAGLLRAGFERGGRVGLAVCLAQLATAVGVANDTLAMRRT